MKWRFSGEKHGVSGKSFIYVGEQRNETTDLMQKWTTDEQARKTMSKNRRQISKKGGQIGESKELNKRNPKLK